MSMRRRLSILWLLFLLPTLASAAGRSPLAGARPMALGGAFTAVADDATTIAYNPAGIALTGRREVGLTRSALFSGISEPLIVQDAVFAVSSLGPGGIGIGFVSQSDAAGVYRETAASIGYAHRIAEFVKIGAQLKHLRVGLDSTNADVVENPYFGAVYDVSAMTLDAGVLLVPVQGVAVGISAQNLVPADLSFQEAEEPDEAPQIVRVGASLRLSRIAESAEQEALRGVLSRSLVAAEVAAGDGTTVGVGAEVGLSDSLVARIGYRTASGVGSVSAVTAGVGLRLDVAGIEAHLDLAIEVLDAAVKDNTSQRLSVRVSF